MDNKRSAISKTISRSLHKPNPTPDDPCNCRNKDCPLTGKCHTNNVVDKASITTTDNGETKDYIGMTINSLRECYRNHAKSFNDKKYANETELWNCVWDLKKKARAFTINRSIVRQAGTYTGAKCCNLCLQQRLTIMKAEIF